VLLVMPNTRGAEAKAAIRGVIVRLAAAAQ
jgi:hypothetical protein